MAKKKADVSLNQALLLTDEIIVCEMRSLKIARFKINDSVSQPAHLVTLKKFVVSFSLTFLGIS